MPASTRLPVFVTGAAGFVGSAVVRELVARGYGVVALARRSSFLLQDAGATIVPGDLLVPAGWRDALSGCFAVIHLVGIIRELPATDVTFQRIHVQGTQAIVDAARVAGVRRYIHMSALGAREHARSDYHRTKFAAEQYVRQSGLDWTIFRPSLIHGPGGEFMHMLAGWTRRRPPLMPYFGRGASGLFDCGKLQPVYVGDVARAFVQSLDHPCVGKTYDLVGPDIVDWPTLYRLLGIALDRRAVPLAIPAWWGALLTRLLPGRWLPFGRDQVIMAQEDNVGDFAPLSADFGWAPRHLGAILHEYAPRLLA